MASIKENIQTIREDIEKYSPNPREVKLVTVTKYVDNEKMKEAFDSASTAFKIWSGVRV